jgi:hypothetical protein
VSSRADPENRNFKADDSRDVNVIQIIGYSITSVFILAVMNIVLNYNHFIFATFCTRSKGITFLQLYGVSLWHPKSSSRYFPRSSEGDLINLPYFIKLSCFSK